MVGRAFPRTSSASMISIPPPQKSLCHRETGCGYHLSTIPVASARYGLAAFPSSFVQQPRQVPWPAVFHCAHSLTGTAGVLVVPGIRPAGAAIGDQKRIATPGVHPFPIGRGLGLDRLCHALDTLLRWAASNILPAVSRGTAMSKGVSQEVRGVLQEKTYGKTSDRVK
jgi:hypothetical protein